jgi:hypothetical protein
MLGIEKHTDATIIAYFPAKVNIFLYWCRLHSIHSTDTLCGVLALGEPRLISFQCCIERNRTPPTLWYPDHNRHRAEMLSIQAANPHREHAEHFSQPFAYSMLAPIIPLQCLPTVQLSDSQRRGEE